MVNGLSHCVNVVIMLAEGEVSELLQHLLVKDRVEDSYLTGINNWLDG